MKTITFSASCLLGSIIGCFLLILLVCLVGCEPQITSVEKMKKKKYIEGAFDCGCDGERVLCPNYIPKSWEEFCLTVLKYDKDLVK